MRIAALIAKKENGKWDALMVTEGDIEPIKSMRQKIIDINGVLVKGKGKNAEEVKISELRVLSNHTSGGELLSPRKF